MTGRCIVSKEIVYTDAQASELMALIRAGFSVVWVDDSKPRPAAHRGGSDEAAPKVRRKQRRRRPNLTAHETVELVALRSKGIPTRTIARKMKMSLSGVRNALHRLGKNGGAA